MKRWLPFAPLVVLVALGVLFAGYALRHDPQVAPNALVGHPLPAAPMPPLAGGEPVPLKSQLQGPALVNVFASWCAPCAVEAPQLMQLRARGVQVIGVAYKDAPAATSGFLNRVGNPYDSILVDRQGDAGVELGITGVPESFLVGADGVIFAKHVGAIEPGDVDKLAAQLQRPR